MSSYLNLHILSPEYNDWERIQTQKVIRTDGTIYFKSEFILSDSGFSATYDISNLKSGKYQIAILLLNNETNKEGLVLTGRTIEK